MSFETDLKRLETITEKLKDENTGLEESLKLYEEASELSKKLSKTLEEVRRKVEAVKEDGSIESFEEK
ncbi:MAG: exodeoxyribonuclease VII small subunit [Spirochaetales bacterium]|nr:exodeoxyribonuclease VII small subunit [Spirochaetales bacterium]